MFLSLKKKKTKYDKNSYIHFLKNLLIDENLKEEIISVLELFNDKGFITFDGNNLYGKIIDKNGSDYIEIKYHNYNFTCIYTDWNRNRSVNISQINLKNNNTKINKSEKKEYICLENQNKTDIEEWEKIYNENNNLVYESNLKQNSSYNSYADKIIYDNESRFENNFELTKNWYIFNGSIITYKLKKENFKNRDYSNESYLICPKVCEEDFQKTYYFDELDQNLFNQFMTGKISIEEVFEQNDKINKVKKIHKK